MSEGGLRTRRESRLAPVLERVGMVLALTAPLVRATVLVSPFPGWELDPFTFPSASSGMGPAGSMLCDCVASLGVVLVFIARWLGGVALPVAPTSLFGLGAIGVLVHTTFSGAHSTVAETWIGSSWVTAMLLGLCLATAPPDERGDRTRALAASVFLGFVALLALRGAQQVFIEHPHTLADFRRNREAIFASQGWSPESPMAKAYERRLVQAEATGWFGLANVFATFAAAGTVMSLTLLAGAVRAFTAEEKGERSINGVLGAGVALGLGAVALYLAGGKGGYMAAAAGLMGVLALFAVRGRNGRLLGPHGASLAGGSLGILALGAVFVLVVVRGAIGDRMSELSLLFRWFYMEAAARIGVGHLPIGVGPDGFQLAYMLAKNPLSPEDVTSSHNMLLDWFATLGVFGLAWGALWIWWIWRAGAAAVDAAPTPAPAPTDRSETARHDRWTLGAIGTLATILAIRIDRDVLTPDAALVRLAGLVAFCVVGWTALTCMRRNAGIGRLALAGAAIAAGTHTLIDVTGVWPASAALIGVLVGSAARRSARGKQAGMAERAWEARAMLPGIACMVLLVGATTFRFFHVSAWEGMLRRSAADADEAGAMNQRWQSIVDGLQTRRPGALEEVRALASELGVTEATPTAVETAVRAHDLKATKSAWTRLLKTESYQDEWKTRREASRVGLRAAGLFRMLGDEAEAAKAEEVSEKMMSGCLPRWNQTPTELGWLALVRQSLAESTGDRKWLQGAAESLEEAAKLAPYDMEYARRLMKLYHEVGDSGRARHWADRVLELDAGMRYDREVKGLSARDREEVMRVKDGI